MLKRLQNEKGSSLIEKLTAISQLLNTNKQKNSPSIFHSMCLHSPINKSVSLRHWLMHPFRRMVRFLKCKRSSV